MSTNAEPVFRKAPLHLRVAVADALRAPGVLQFYQEGGYDYQPDRSDDSLSDEINARLNPDPPCTRKMVAHVRTELFGMSARGKQREQTKEANKAAAISGASTLIEAVQGALSPDREIIAALQRVEAKLDRLMAEWITPAEHG